MSQLGNNIYEARMAHNWSQRTVAAKLDVDVMTWSRWERGENQPPLSQLARIAKLLGTTVSKLTRGV